MPKNIHESSSEHHEDSHEVSENHADDENHLVEDSHEDWAEVLATATKYY